MLVIDLGRPLQAATPHGEGESAAFVPVARLNGSTVRICFEYENCTKGVPAARLQ